MKHYFINPDEYEKHSKLQYNFAHQMISMANIKNTDNVLDIGCGDGKITSDIADMAFNGRVIGTDISENMIQFANRAHAKNKKNLAFLVMDAENNIFKNQFEVVVSFCCLHWVKNQSSALSGIKSALKKDGEAILLVPLRHEELYSAIEIVINKLKWKTYFKDFYNPHVFFTKKQYEIFLTSAGLSPKILDEEIMTYSFDKIDEMGLFLKAWLPHLKNIPKDFHDYFMQEIVSIFTEIVPDDQGCYLMPLRMLKVKASFP